MSVNLEIAAIFLGVDDENHEDFKFEVSGLTVGECLDQFLANGPALKKNFFNNAGKLGSGIYVFVNGSPVALDPLDKKVKNGDRIRVTFARENG